MLDTRIKQPIKVEILEISAQNKALLEFFFNDSGKSCFKEVDANQASCFIIDYDSPGAKESWETTFKESQKPGIILSTKEVDLPSTVWVAKPLTAKALIDASFAMREMIDAEGSIKETAIITPVEKKRKVQHEEIIEDISQHEDIPLDTVSEMDNIEVEDVTFEALKAVEQEYLHEVMTTEQQVEEMKIVAEKPELVVTSSKTAASSSDVPVSYQPIDISNDLNALDLLIDDDDDDISTTAPSNKTEIDNNLNNDDDMNSLLESLISEGENDNSFTADVSEPEAIEANHKVEELPEQSPLEDFDIEAFAKELEKNVYSNDEENEDENEHNDDDNQETIDALVTEILEPTEADNNTDADADVANIINDSEVKSTLTASKPPIKSAEDELEFLLEEIRQEAIGTTSKGRGKRKTYLPTMADKRKHLTCGENEKDQSLQSLCTITPHEHILSSLLKTIEQAKETNTVFRVKLEDIFVVIDPKTDSIYCDESIFSDYYANICHTPASKDDIKIHQLDESETRLYRTKIEAGDKNAHSIESFIWTTSLVTHQGHLPVATDINKEIRLKYWPNLTRLENLPHAIKIAAFIHKCPKSLAKITNEMDIPKKYIIAFYNALLSLDFIDQDGRKYPSETTSIGGKSNRNRGFFSRFLQKLSA